MTSKKPRSKSEERRLAVMKKAKTRRKADPEQAKKAQAHHKLKVKNFPKKQLADGEQFMTVLPAFDRSTPAHQCCAQKTKR